MQVQISASKSTAPYHVMGGYLLMYNVAYLAAEMYFQNLLYFCTSID